MRRLMLIPVGATMIALAACGSSAPSAPSTPASSAPIGALPPTSASSSGLQTQSASQVLAAAQSAFSSATSVAATGSATSDGKRSEYTLKAQKSGDLDGTFRQAGSTYQVILVGEQLFVKLDAATVEQKYGQAAATLIGERWIKTSSNNSDYESLAELTFPNLAQSLNKETAKSTPPEAGTVNGQPVVTIELANGNKLSVADTGPAYPVRSVESDQGMIDFADYNTVPPVTAPSDFIDLDQLQSASPTPTS